MTDEVKINLMTAEDLAAINGFYAGAMFAAHRQVPADEQLPTHRLLKVIRDHYGLQFDAIWPGLHATIVKCDQEGWTGK